MTAAELDSTVSLAAALRRIPILSDLPEPQICWFASKCSQKRLQAGEVYIHEGDPASHMSLLLEGEIRARKEGLGADQPAYTVYAPSVTGALPFSRMTEYPLTSRAATPAWFAAFPRDLFPELTERIPQLMGRLVSTMADRIRDVALANGQHEKLVALGRLSAGFAHELNNPASVVKSAAVHMQQSLRALLDANVQLDDRPLTVEQRRYLACAERETILNLQSRPTLDSLSRSDRESSVAEWLRRHGVEASWDLAPALVELDWSDADLEDLASRFDAFDLPCVLARLTATLSVGQLLSQIDEAAGRISRLVDTIADYSHMDRTPEGEIDIHDGLDATLGVFGHRLRKGVVAVRDYDRSIPHLLAHVGALNQVWTKLIENALDAMPEGGELRIRTRRALDSAVVDIIDTGHGIPDEIRHRVFEPFFTTKPFGTGTGLGLDTAYRIVRQHHGQIEFECDGAGTCFRVTLPFRRLYGI